MSDQNKAVTFKRAIDVTRGWEGTDEKGNKIFYASFIDSSGVWFTIHAIDETKLNKMFSTIMDALGVPPDAGPAPSEAGA